MKKSLLFGIIFLFFFAACKDSSSTERRANSSSPRIKKNVTLVSPSGNQQVTAGSSIVIQIQHKDEEGVIDSAFLIVNSAKRPLVGNTYEIDNLNTIGKQSIQIIAYSEGKKETLYPSITVLPDQAPVDYSFQVLSSYPHDENAWTQGLFFHQGNLYETTGQKGESSLRKVTLETGEVASIVNLESQYFGEGATVWDDQIYYLTWTSRIGFVYDLSFNRLRTFNFPTEGWGITTYADTLIMSDGTEQLYFINPKDFSTMKIIQVYDNDGKVDELNELEMIGETLYANIWGKDEIVMIEPATGTVTGRIDFTGLYEEYRSNKYDKSLNGIAVDDAGGIFVTGKLWPYLYKVSITQKNNPT